MTTEAGGQGCPCDECERQPICTAFCSERHEWAMRGVGPSQVGRRCERCQRRMVVERDSRERACHDCDRPRTRLERLIDATETVYAATLHHGPRAPLSPVVAPVEHDIGPAGIPGGIPGIPGT